MKQKYVSFIIIPPNQESWNFSLSVRTLWIVGSCFFVFSFVTVLSMISLGYLVESIQTVKQLQNQNRQLKTEQEKIVLLQEELTRSKHKLGQIYSLMGIDTTMTKEKAGTSAPILASMGDIGSMNNGQVADEQFSSQEVKNAIYQLKNAQKQVPSIWPTSGIVSQKFRWNESYSNKHPGIDIATSEGTPVVATADGYVVMADWDNALGNTIMIDHKNGFSTLYGHNSRLLVANGAAVTRGQIIALSGNTGKSSAPHLHYEVRKSGNPVNPDEYLTN